MPQVQLPVFPDGVTHITSEIAFERREGKVCYFNGHPPVFIRDCGELAKRQTRRVGRRDQPARLERGDPAHSGSPLDYSIAGWLSRSSTPPDAYIRFRSSDSALTS